MAGSFRLEMKGKRGVAERRAKRNFKAIEGEACGGKDTNECHTDVLRPPTTDGKQLCNPPPYRLSSAFTRPSRMLPECFGVAGDVPGVKRIKVRRYVPTTSYNRRGLMLPISDAIGKPSAWGRHAA